MQTRRYLVTSLLITVALAAQASTGPRQERSGAASLEWLAGSWYGMDGTTRVEEVWMRPAAGVMLGMHRDVDSAGLVWFEFLRIETRGGVTTYAAMPGGRPAVLFTMKEMTRTSVIFENPENDFPQRIIYRLGEDGMLHARIEGVKDGVVRSKEWVWGRNGERKKEEAKTKKEERREIP